MGPIRDLCLPIFIKQNMTSRSDSGVHSVMNTSWPSQTSTTGVKSAASKVIIMKAVVEMRKRCPIQRKKRISYRCNENFSKEEHRIILTRRLNSQNTELNIPQTSPRKLTWKRQKSCLGKGPSIIPWDLLKNAQVAPSQVNIPKFRSINRWTTMRLPGE